jgi:hypothetical protein
MRWVGSWMCVLWFLCAFLSASFSTRSAAADAPPAVIQSAPLGAPAAVLGFRNPYVIAAAAGTLQLQGFNLSRDLMGFAKRVERLATFGVDLNQRKLPRTDKLNLRVRGRYGGGVLQLCYRR